MDLNQMWKMIVGDLYLNKTIDEDVKSEFFPTSSLHKISKKDFVVVVKSVLGVSFLNQISHLIKECMSSFVKDEFVLKIITFEEFKKVEKIDDGIFIKSAFNSTFENFIYGESNRQAYIAAKFFSESEDSATFNPLFIFGDSGLGKTHLLEAIANNVSKQAKNNKVLFLTADEFTNRVVSALNSGEPEIEKFKNKILESDVFMIDDVHFLTKRDKTNEFLFFVINSYLENGKKLAFSSDKNPEALNGFEKRMITRFNSGLSVSVETLDVTTAKSILELRILEFNLKRSVSKEALHFLAENFGSDARKLKSLANRLELLILSFEGSGEITLVEVISFFKEVPSSSLGLLNVKRIKEIVGDKYGVTPKAIDGKARTTAIKDARHVSMYFAKVILNHTSTQIGSEFGGRDHSTVLSAISRIEKNIYNDKSFKKLVESLRNKIVISCGD